MNKKQPLGVHELFFATEDDAISVVVMALGGAKKVGPLLWPGLKRAEQRLNDCLNPNRDEKLSPAELIQLARWGRDVGCHAIAVYFNAEAGYAPPVSISPEDEKAELQRQTREAVRGLMPLLQKLQKHGFEL